MIDLTAKAFYRYRDGFGHYCGPTCIGQYKMSPSWIDTDNTVWSEPYSLYTDSRDDVSTVTVHKQRRM